MLMCVSAARLLSQLPHTSLEHRNDSKEIERKKFVQLLRSYATQYASRTNGMGPQVWLLDLQVGVYREDSTIQYSSAVVSMTGDGYHG